MVEVQGSCDERFSHVRDVLAEQLDGEELGASIAVDIDGETVVDLWGGYRDEARTTPWTRDTIVNGWSTTKCVTNLAAPSRTCTTGRSPPSGSPNKPRGGNRAPPRATTPTTRATWSAR